MFLFIYNALLEHWKPFYLLKLLIFFSFLFINSIGCKVCLCDAHHCIGVCMFAYVNRIVVDKEQI